MKAIDQYKILTSIKNMLEESPSKEFLTEEEIDAVNKGFKDLGIKDPAFTQVYKTHVDGHGTQFLAYNKEKELSVLLPIIDDILEILVNPLVQNEELVRKAK